MYIYPEKREAGTLWPASFPVQGSRTAQLYLLDPWKARAGPAQAM